MQDVNEYSDLESWDLEEKVTEKQVAVVPLVSETQKAVEIKPAKDLNVSALREPKSQNGKIAKRGKSTAYLKLRSPILCIMGHVDTGKTKLLDKIRRTNVGEKEAGNITQQIGATFFPRENLLQQCNKVDSQLDLRVPGLLIIDTPGHASFANLRKRGSSLCDLAILVVDIMHGVEPQTTESVELLKQRKCPFLVALNKVDRIYGWAKAEWTPFLKTLKAQKKYTQDEFSDRANRCLLDLTESQGLNFELYYNCQDVRRSVSVVPTSAQTGEGIPDLLTTIVKLSQDLMARQIQADLDEVECTILDVKNTEGLGTTIDVILISGVLEEGNKIVVCGMNGAIVTNIRSILTPLPMKELRVKGEYQRHKRAQAAMGLKIAAANLESAVAGTSVEVVKSDISNEALEVLKRKVQQDMTAIFKSIDKAGVGVYVMASTLGSLEALLSFLKDSNIPVNGINIGCVYKMDVIKASTMHEHGHEEFAVILAFDVKVDSEAEKTAKDLRVTIYCADIIYHLFDKFTQHLEDYREEQKRLKSKEAIFPCILQILPNCLFNKKDPLIFGVRVDDGDLRVGTPLIVPDKNLKIGSVDSIEYQKKTIPCARKGQEVCIKITGDSNVTIGRHFDVKDRIVSHISRASINVMKEHFRSDLTEHAKLIVHLKKVLGII